jgi:cytochrome b
MMANLAWDTWFRLVAWLIVGFIIYFGYGIHHSRLNQPSTQLTFDTLKEEESVQEMVPLEE